MTRSAAGSPRYIGVMPQRVALWQLLAVNHRLLRRRVGPRLHGRLWAPPPGSSGGPTPSTRPRRRSACAWDAKGSGSSRYLALFEQTGTFAPRLCLSPVVSRFDRIGTPLKQKASCVIQWIDSSAVKKRGAVLRNRHQCCGRARSSTLMRESTPLDRFAYRVVYS